MASGMIVQTRPNIGFATETLLVSNSVQVLSPSIYAPSTTSGGAASAFLTNYGASIRYFYSGANPDASTGHVLQDGGMLVLTGQNQMASFKCIRLSSEDSTITITYERE